jgi:hypothetical protein
MVPRWMQRRIGKTIHFARSGYLELSCGILTGTTQNRPDAGPVGGAISRTSLFSMISTCWNY